VQQVGLDQALRLPDLPTVARKIQLVAALRQPLQRADIGAHAAFRRRHDARVPAHHVVAGEEDFRALEGEAQMIRSVPWRVQGRERPSVPLQPLSVRERHVGDEILFHILPARGAGALGAAVGDAAPEAHGLSPRYRREQGGHAVGVIAVGVGDDDVADPPRAHGAQDGLQMRRVVRTRIDEGERAGADQICVGAFEREVVGVVGDDAHHARDQLARLAVGEDHRLLEGQFFRHGIPVARR